MGNKELGIIILNYNGYHDTIECINSILQSKYIANYQIFIVDNNSDMENCKKLIDYMHFLKKQSYKVKIENNIDIVIKGAIEEDVFLIFSPFNMGFSKGCNLICKIAMCNNLPYVLFLNNDTIIEKNAIDIVLNGLKKDKDIVMGTCQIKCFNNGELWNAGGIVAPFCKKYYTRKYVDRCIKHQKKCIATEFVSGCFMMIKTSIFKKVGYLDEFFFFGAEDFEWSLRLKKEKMKCATFLDACIFHKVSRSSNSIRTIARWYYHYLSYIYIAKRYTSKMTWFVAKNLYFFAIYIMVIRKKEIKKPLYFMKNLFYLFVNNVSLNCEYKCLEKYIENE